MKVNYEGGQITTAGSESLKKAHFSPAKVTFFIFCLTAAGCFGIESMISSSGPGMTMILLVLIPAMWAMPMGLFSSELTNLAPQDTGLYVWAKMAFGEFWGFSFGFWMAVAWYLGGASYVVLAIDYIGTYFPMSPVTAFLIKAAIIIVFTIVNLLGLEEVSILSTIFTFIILIAFVIVAVIGLTHWTYNPFTPVINNESGGAASMGAGIAIGVWMFCGYTAIANMGGEIENPQVIPTGMKFAIILIAVSYILPTLGGLASLGHWQEWGSTIDYSSVISTYVGKGGGIAFMCVAVISQLALFNATTATAGRSFIAIGEDHLCPKFLSTVSKKRGTPVWPLLILAVLNLFLVNLDFEVLVIIVSPLLFICYAGAAIMFYRLRKLYPVEKRGDLYYIKGKYSPIYIVVAMCIIGVVGILMNGTEYFLMGYVLIIAAFIMYFVCKKIYGGLSVNQPELYPRNEKTGLCKGDLERFSRFFLIFGVLAAIGDVFLRFYEGSWAIDYYKETYGSGFLSDWNAMMMVLNIVVVVFLLAAIAFKLIGKKYDPVPKD